MYESFYHFRTPPFSLLPDPEFFFLSTRHKQGLTLLEYGLYNHALFTVLTGEPGTGKTTLLNKILALNSGRFTVGVITTPHPEAGSLLPWVADAFGLECSGQDTAGYFRALTAFLGRAFAAGEQVLLVVDEAHNLNVHMLESLRLLSNITGGRQSSIQIILAGQPTLRTLLARSDLRQLAQRVAVEYALEPLNAGEASAYVQHRLRVAGGEPALVTEYACALVHQLSGGNPRLINQLCDLALMYGFGEGGDRITAALLWQAAVDRAHGGILPCVVDPRTILLDPARLNQESQARGPKPVPAPVLVPHETPAPVASIHANGSKGDILPVVVDPRATLLDPTRLSQESERAPKPVPVPVPVAQETPAPVASVHANGSKGDILPAVVDPRATRLDPVRLNQASRARESNPVPAPQETPAPPVATVHANGSKGDILPAVVDPRATRLDPTRLNQEAQAYESKSVSVRHETPPPPVASEHKNAPSKLYREGLGLRQTGLYREALKKFEAAERDITAALLWQAAVDRAHGGTLPVVVDPRTLLLDPARLSQESQERVPKPVPAPVLVPQETPAPVATVHQNAPTELYREGFGLKQAGLYREALKKFEAAERDITAALLWQAAVDRAHGGTLPAVVDPRTLLLDPARLSQESQERVPKPVPAPVLVPQETPALPVASVHANGSKGDILLAVVDPRAILLDPTRLNQEAQTCESKSVSVQHETPPPPVDSVHKNAPTELYREGLGLKQAGLYREALTKFEAAKGDPAYRFKASVQRKLMICLYLGLSTLIAAHIVSAFIAHELLVPDISPPPLPAQDNAHRDSVSPQQLAQDMMTRGLFALPAGFSQSAGFSTGAGLGPPLEAAKKLLLHGTALGIGNKPMAIVQDQSSKEQKLLHLHDRVPNVGELVSIEQTRVLFQDRGQEEWLELAMLTDLAQSRRMPPLPEPSQGRSLALPQSAPSTHLDVLTPVVSPAAAVSSAGSSRQTHVIDRRELSKTLSDIPLLLLQAQPVVSMIDGRFNGILLEAVRADGLYSQMGLRSDDVLKRINGMELREPSMLIAALEQMKDEQRVKLDVVRDKTPHTFTYEIR